MLKNKTKLSAKIDLTENRDFSNTLTQPLNEIVRYIDGIVGNINEIFENHEEMPTPYCACCGRQIFPWSEYELCDTCNRSEIISNLNKRIPWSVFKKDYTIEAKDIFNLR